MLQSYFSLKFLIAKSLNISYAANAPAPHVSSLANLCGGPSLRMAFVSHGTQDLWPWTAPLHGMWASPGSLEPREGDERDTGPAPDPTLRRAGSFCCSVPPPS